MSTYDFKARRLFVEAPLHIGARVVPTPAARNYLLNVLRLRADDPMLLFNGRDGEWLAEIAEAGKRDITLRCLSRTDEQKEVPDLWLAFAPIKKTPADYLVQKAAELGVRALVPVFTRRTIVTRVNAGRMRANAVEAAEQSGRLSVPEVCEAVSFDRLLAQWPKARRLYFCDEGGDAQPLAEAAKGQAGPAGILTGPEGGFDPVERAALRACDFVVPVTLGPRILRADTAALAALAIWQSVGGDFA